MSGSPPGHLTVKAGDGRTLDVLLSGPEDGTVMVFHTGTPVGLVPLPPQLEPDRLGIRTVMYARPGYAGSTSHPGRTVADAAGDTAAILGALGAEEFVNVGWSGGGPHSLACAAMLRDRCKGTAIVAGLAPYAGGSDEVRAWFESDEDNQRAIAGDIEGFRKGVDAFAALLSQLTPELAAEHSESAADREFLSTGYADWVATFFRTAFDSGTDGAVGDWLAFLEDWGFPLGDVGPVTIWHGVDDRNVPIAHGRWLAENLPDADLRVFEEDGHVSIIRLLPEIIEDLRTARS